MKTCWHENKRYISYNDYLNLIHEKATADLAVTLGIVDQKELRETISQKNMTINNLVVELEKLK